MPLSNLIPLDQICFTDSQWILGVFRTLSSQIGSYLCTLLCTFTLELLEPSCMATDAFPLLSSQGHSCLPLCVCSRDTALALLPETSQWPREVKSRHWFHAGVNAMISLTHVLPRCSRVPCWMLLELLPCGDAEHCFWHMAPWLPHKSVLWLTSRGCCLRNNLYRIAETFDLLISLARRVS